jgi:5-methylcytosine-specific restriction endonuclease McrA
VHCVDCGHAFEQVSGRGRPRARCEGCSPPQRRPTGWYKGVFAKSLERRVSCPQCGVQYTATYDLRKYCSEQCRIDAGNARQAGLRGAALWRRRPRVCRWCAQAYLPRVQHQVFCSYECKRRSNYSRPEKQGTAHIRRALIFGCAVEQVDKWVIFERDGWRCCVCRVPTPRELSGTHEHNAPELDHDVPLRRGGPHSVSNTQLLCHSCNRAKGVMTTAEFVAAMAS